MIETLRKVNCSATLALTASLWAAAYTASAQEEDDDDIFELSPFVIDASQDEGWRAGNTLTGSRTNQALKNVPLSVDAMTTDFMEDMGIHSLDEAGEFIAGLEFPPSDERTNDNGASFRGLSLGGRENAASSRNNFLWYPRTDSFNIERIDFNKGSNSLMFGDASPGGQATVYTKRAQFRDFGAASVLYGEHDTSRFTLDVNRKINDKAAFRINYVESSKRSYIDFGDDNVRGIHLASTVKLFENTTLRFEFEDLTFDRTRARSDVSVNQEASGGLGFTSSSRQVFTSDGDFYNPRRRVVDPDDATGEETERSFFASDGNGGFMDPFVIASADRQNSATGDDLSLVEGVSQTVRVRNNLEGGGDPFLTVGPVPRGVNVNGLRSFLNRDINNYSIFLEQSWGGLNVELAANRQEQFQNRNDNDFSRAISVDGDGRLFNEGDLDRKWFGNDVNTVRLTASYPLEFGDRMSQFLVGNVTYLDDLAYSFRQRLVNQANAIDPNTGEYDPAHDSEGRDRIRVRAYLDGDNPFEGLQDPDRWNDLLPENLPHVPGVFEPLWVNYTTSNKPFTDKRYSKSASLSAVGTYFDGKLRSLLGVREDEFDLKRYILPGGSRAERVAEFGEIAYWGQDVYLGSPDEAPDSYAYVPELSQSATTYNVGLVYKLNNDFNVYANKSTSFRWQGTEDFLGRALGPQDGETREIGLKGSFMEDKIDVTLAVYEIDRENVAFRVSSANNSSEIERLFNDTEILIDPDTNELIYQDPDPSSPNYLQTGMGLNQEHRQVTSNESVQGWEINILTRRTAGLQARFAISHLEVESTVDLSDYAEQVELARGRKDLRQAFLDQYWPSDPNYVVETLPSAEEDLRQSLEDAEQVLVDNAGTGAITGSRSRPYTASWILDYQFGDETPLKGLRVLLSGSYADNYLLSTNDGVRWMGGATHPVHLSFNYKTKLMDYPVDLRLRLRDIHDFENSDFKERGGFVDRFSGLETWQSRNIRPMSWELSAKVRF
ncbi:MAG: TonB-dependent receptor [Verrucomicrobiota bacterium]